ncbi:hypothetical protein AM571_PB00282 (plasmid) [Rhizobium etli 8C-3]|uniref:Uncharacterized protein n=1 Tax=Rhizobium etli 8C-3 TaxID=538025 RepID=A0A1L5PBF2_RHIET|nr:hypothetical protein AM571_PB00282 [Rhizobium etli 8C-3]
MVKVREGERLRRPDGRVQTIVGRPSPYSVRPCLEGMIGSGFSMLGGGRQALGSRFQI